MAQIIADTPVHYETSGIKVKYNADLNYIDEIWLNYMEDEDIKEAKIKLAKMLAYTNCSSYLSDMLNFKGATPEMMLFVKDVWFPLAYEKGLRNLAMVLPPDMFASLALETAISSHVVTKLNAKKFSSYNEAQQWLIQFTK